MFTKDYPCSDTPVDGKIEQWTKTTAVGTKYDRQTVYKRFWVTLRNGSRVMVQTEHSLTLWNDDSGYTMKKPPTFKNVQVLESSSPLGNGWDPSFTCPAPERIE